MTSETHAILWNGKSEEEVKKLKPKTIKSLITDPPFGVDNQSNMAVTEAGKEYARKIANDENPEIAMEIFASMWTNLAGAMREDSDIYVFTAHQVLEEWLTFTKQMFEPWGYKRKAILVWQKDGPGMGDLQSWGMGCEFILYYKRGTWERNDTRRNNVISIPQLRPSELIHPHEKPEALLELLIKHSTQRGDWVIDPYMGSGSLVRAARKLGRPSIGIELDEKNFDLANRKLNSGEGVGMDFGDFQ